MIKRFLVAVAIVMAASGAFSLSTSSVVGFFVTLSLVFLLAVSGTVTGLWLAWPGGGRGWDWKRAWLLIVSAIFLAAVVAFIVIVIIAMGDIHQ